MGTQWALKALLLFQVFSDNVPRSHARLALRGEPRTVEPGGAGNTVTHDFDDAQVRAVSISGGAPPKPIVTEDLTESAKGFGNAVYPENLESWSSFRRAVGSLAKQCDPKEPMVACGMQLVCRNGLCAPCISDSECPDKHWCQSEVAGRNVCVARSLFQQFGQADIALTVMIFLCTVLSAASGVGGGGMFVPLFLIFLDLTPTDAVPLSQSLILAASIVNLSFFIFQRHPLCRSRPKIDYETVMLLEPGLAAGVVVGVILNRVSPRWLITTLLILTLGLSFWRTSTKALSLWKKESESKTSPRPANPEEKTFDLGALKLLDGYRVPLGIITIVWLLTFLSNFHRVKSCSWQFAVYLCAFFLSMIGITYAGGQYLQSGARRGDRSEEELAAGIEWTPWTTSFYPAIAFAAGLLGGQLGLGGGIIMGPFLVEIGLNPEVIQASTATFVLISSSLAALQFAAKDQVMPEYVMFYGAVSVAASLIGQTLVLNLIRKSGRSSIILMCISMVLIISMVMMTYLGIMGTIADIDRGAYMGLDFHKLCLA